MPGAFSRALFGALAVLLYTACASAPRTVEASLDGPLPLDGGALLYLVADVPRARPLLDRISIEGLAKEDAARILDRTRYAAAALFPPDSGRRLQAAAWGNYPRFGAGLALASARDWKKHRSPAGPFWYSAERDISLAFNRSRAFAALGPAGPGAAGTASAAGAKAATGTPPAGTAAGPYTRGPGVPPPEGFAAFQEGACLALWLENPVEPLNRFLEGLRLPIRIPAEEFLAALVPLSNSEETAGAEDRTWYEIRLQIRAPSAANARSLMTLLSAARLFIPGTEEAGSGAAGLFSLLFSRPPEQEGPYIKLRSAAMDEEGIALLFTLFSLYSGQN